MRKTLHLTDDEMIKLLDIIDFTSNCIVLDLNIYVGEKKYQELKKSSDLLNDYSKIYNKISNALDFRFKKEELKKSCKE